MNLYFLNIVQGCKKIEREKVKFVDDEYYGHHRVDYRIGKPKIERDNGQYPKSMMRVRYRHNRRRSVFWDNRYLGVLIWEWGAYSYQGYDSIELYGGWQAEKIETRIPLMISRIKKGRGENFVHRSILEYHNLNS
jgi:hypothetical protein